MAIKQVQYLHIIVWLQSIVPINMIHVYVYKHSLKKCQLIFEAVLYLNPHWSIIYTTILVFARFQPFSFVILYLYCTKSYNSYCRWPPPNADVWHTHDSCTCMPISQTITLKQYFRDERGIMVQINNVMCTSYAEMMTV